MFVVEVVGSSCSSRLIVNTAAGGLLENVKLKTFKPALKFDSSLSTHFELLVGSQDLGM